VNKVSRLVLERGTGLREALDSSDYCV
jgi:hypothetical protein